MHQSVLYHEIINGLRPHSEGRYVDGTVGAGGHARGILAASAPNGLLLGLDKDPQALRIAREKLANYGPRVTLVHASYASILEQIAALGWPYVDGIVLDLGVSSMQFDNADRGFSFRSDAPLDMRFDATAGELTAADLVNTLPESDLADLFFRYGEDRNSRRIARAVVQSRPITTTGQLADLVAGISKREKIHPATRIFQALRIAVNQELDVLETMLPRAVAALVPGGRLAVISFHSLEDRLVKQFFRQESRDCLCPSVQPVCTCEHQATIREVTRKPIWSSDEEVQANPRARSARLRVAERI